MFSSLFRIAQCRTSDHHGLAVQAIICMFLSVNHGANNASSSVGVFTMMLALHDTGVITETVHIHFMWRAIHAVGMTLGTVLLGFRLAPVAGELA